MEYDAEGSHRPAYGVTVLVAADSAVEADHENICVLPLVDLGRMREKRMKFFRFDYYHMDFKVGKRLRGKTLWIDCSY